MEKTDEELISEGITDIPMATEKMNKMLQEREEAFAEAYNNEQEGSKRREAYAVLEEYLFGKASKKKKSKNHGSNK